jgi:protocatechuate 3,4-dioxygenase beta subunit
VDERLNRSDIRSDPAGGAVKAGIPLHLTLRTLRVTSPACTPLAGATVDIWHCDALGLYSDERANGTVGQKFLRGYQTTDANGVVRFTTIYPGWYMGRTVHIHFKVHTPDATAAGRGYEFTSQLYFDDSVTDRVHTQAPYASRVQRSLRNRDDGIYRRGGRQLTLAVNEDGRSGYTATFDIGLRMA